MQSRCGWMLPALLCLSLLPVPFAVADEVKKKEAKDEARSPAPKPDYRFLSDVSEVEPNDTPAQATPLGCGNTLRPAEIAVQAVRDTDWISFTANAGDLITFGTDDDGPSPVGDTRISIVSDDGTTVLASDDDGGPVAYSLVAICAPYTGTYYGRVAAFSSQTGTYMAFLTCAPSGAPNDRCAGAIPLACGPIALSGTTANACPDYTLPESGCTGFFANGRDVVYRLDVLAGDSLYLDYAQSAADASIYIVADCADPAGTCIAGEDSTLVGGHETLSHTFAAAGTYYLILDSFSPGSGGPWTATGALTCVPDQVDTLASAHLEADLTGPWGTERVAFNGTTTLHTTTRALADNDFDGLDQVPIELAQLELEGHSLNAGPVTLRVRAAISHPYQRSLGFLEETSNATPGALDAPPYVVSLATYVQLEMPVLKLTLHHHGPLGLAGTVLTLPPAPGNTLVAPGPVPLYESDEAPTSWQVGNIVFVPDPVVSTESLSNARLTVDVLGPLGLDTAVLKGTAVLVSRIGNLGDTDGDGVEQIGFDVAAMDMSGVSPLYGAIHATLDAPTPHPLPATAGEIEENFNAQTARLDLPPFAPSGTASSSFDLFLRVEIGGAAYHNHVAKHMAGTLSLFQYATETYRNFVPTPLLDDNDAATPYQLRRMFFVPLDLKPDSTQVDSFPASRLTLDVAVPWGFDQIVMHGLARTETYLGTLHDGDDNGREEMGASLLGMAFTSAGSVLGHVPGPVTLVMLDTLGLGEIEETTNFTPGTPDLPPFTPVGEASARFYEVLFEMEIPGFPTLRNATPSLLEATLRRIPVEPGDTYFAAADNPLVDAGELPSGITIVEMRLTPMAGATVSVPEPALPGSLAIRDLRPNPTSGSATVTLALPRAGNARVAAYDVNGRLVRTLWDGPMEAGTRTLAWDGTGDRGTRVPGGVYFIRLECGGRIAARRLAILR